MSQPTVSGDEPSSPDDAAPDHEREMPMRRVPESWRPYMREAALIRMCLNAGLNSLSKANHADTGLYSQAFFNLHAGLERLLKMIFIIDFALNNAGRLPSNEDLRNRFRHDLVPLFQQARDVRTRLLADGEVFYYDIVDVQAAERIVGVLAEFGVSTRYYNLDYLVGVKKLGRDPVDAWAGDVAKYLLKDYPPRLAREDETFASFADLMLGEHSIIRRETERGDEITDIKTEVLHGRRGQWVQKTATFHVATIIRYLTEVLRALNYRCLPGSRLELPSLWEYFAPYDNDDRGLKGRRTFL